MGNTLTFTPEFLAMLSKETRANIPVSDEYSEYKTNGVKKATKADSIRNYADFITMSEYFLNKKQWRNYALWVIGISAGLRMSDLRKFKFRHFYDDDWNFRKRILVKEQKTEKINNVLITESMKKALNIYLENQTDFLVTGDTYLFKTREANTPITLPQYWRILKAAAEKTGIAPEVHISTHTMRHTFANIVAVCDKTHIDADSITKIQGLLNHSSPTVTMKYMDVLRQYYDRCRITVSDFCLGKTEQKELKLNIVI